MTSNVFGFSTGALERANHRAAIEWMRHQNLRAIELSALRLDELAPLVADLDQLELDGFTHISFHAPSAFPLEQEDRVLGLLDNVANRPWNIVAHPDVIHSPAKWRRFGDRLLLENMDRRKSTGRTVSELNGLLTELPEARLCLDVAHARQLDTTLTLLWSLIQAFGGRIAQMHISELDSRCRHRPLSIWAVEDYRRFAADLAGIPVIIESDLYDADSATKLKELEWAAKAMQPLPADKIASRIA